MRRSLLAAALLAASFGCAWAQDDPSNGPPNGPPPGYQDDQQGGPPPNGPPPGYQNDQQGGPPPQSGQGGRMKMKDRFAQANTTHDGRLTRDQAQNGGLQNIARHWDEIDVDHKGYVTMQDMKAYRRNKAAQRNGPQSGGPGGDQGQDGGPPQ